MTIENFNPSVPVVGDRKKVGISKPVRSLVAVFGVVSWIAGCIGTFRTKNTIGFTTLIVIGAIALLIAAIGRWPSKVDVGGNEIDIPEMAIERATLRSLVKFVPDLHMEELLKSASPRDAKSLKKVME